MAQYNVLVSSIGGDVGQAVCKALKYSSYDIKILGTDCKNYVPYCLFCDSFHKIPEAGEPSYKDSIVELIEDNHIDLVYVCSEQELFYICDHFIELSPKISSKIAIPPPCVISICRDKYKTAEFLRENGFPYPHSIIYNKSIILDKMLEGFSFPLVLKKVHDCGSKNLRIIGNIGDFEYIDGLDSNFMLQEYITGTEYTNGVYKDSISNEIYVASLERSLKNGISDAVKVVADNEIKELCIEVGKKLELSGSVNIQLRKQEGGKPVIFEINPRYSSTSFMRARFGFNDVIYAFENMVLEKSIAPPLIRGGEAYRYMEEYYLFH